MGKCPIVLDRTGQDVHAEGERIRAQGPVTLVEVPGGFHAWSITNYEIAKSVLVDPRFAKNAREHWPAFINGEVPPDWELITWVVMDNMNTHDGADHDRLRKLVSHAFTTRQVEKARPMIEKIVARLLDDIAATPAGEPVDVKSRYFYPLAATVICDLFGVPESARAGVLQGSVVNSKTTNSAEQAEANLHQWQSAMTDLVETKRREPGDDLTTTLISAREEGDTPLTDEETVGTLHLMFGAGTETVSNVLAHAVLDLLTHPDQLELVRTGRYGWDAVFQETVRKEGAVAQLPFRYATEDVEIGGVTVAKGDLVLIGYSAIGRDPELHGETAGEFDITRADKTNLGFGYGPHRCLGMPLATLQAAIALPALFERFPDLRMAVDVGELEPQGTFIMNGHREVPVLVSAAPVAAVPVPAA
ncbi:cytochrome P450 [Actinacidiphila sp. DG2A-62]|uniref:cytochrome P450 family protein n=1 Tax=Actinacidiphila sp. DG2A-62 TaxID=3108821 RepID=UPI002DBCCFC2|nr:cytochrome P450 [Actinacidiphila sp. DG2A-62]MEC3992638.1 cytochrome P450 [Actinacidiphila sp. DG2A-62]